MHLNGIALRRHMQSMWLHYKDCCNASLQIEGSRRNIEEHYDAGNAMYKLFLDETMTYSSGIHTPGASYVKGPQ